MEASVFALIAAAAPECCGHAMVSYGGCYSCEDCGKSVVRSEFYCREENLPALRERFAKLAKRAAKLGVAAPVLSEAAPVDTVETVKDDDGRKVDVVVRRIPVTMSAETVKLAGWTFAAAIDHLEEGINLVRSAGGEIPVTYRSEGPTCDHCHLARPRKATYVLRHEDGRWARVGSSCLADFLGHHSPANAVAAAEWLAELLGVAEESDWGGGGGGVYRFPLADVLAMAAAVIREHGWVSRKTANERDVTPTSTRVWFHLTATARELRNANAERLIPSEADKAKAEEGIAWALAFLETGKELSDYEYNVTVVARVGSVEHKTLGIAVSILGSLSRAKRSDKKPFVAGYVGTVGKREDWTVTVEKIIPCDSEWGTSFLHLARTEDDHAVKWFASTGPLCDEGTTLRVRGTVKKHEEREGIDGTVLTRVTEAPAPKEKKARAPRKAKAGPAAPPAAPASEEPGVAA